MIDLQDFIQELRLQNLSEKTIRQYRYMLAKISRNREERREYLISNRSNHMLIFAYRKYLKFKHKQGEISSDELYAQLDTFRPPKRRGQAQNAKWFSRDQWESLVANAPNRCAKMGIWLGLQFGLRIGEITHLRVEDIDLERQLIHIQIQKDWHPKHFRERSIPMTSYQKEILGRWIKELPVLDHPYLIYNKRNHPVNDRTFQRWCKKAHPELKAHDLRRSFAKVLYYDSKKDLKLVQLTLGHASIATTSRYLSLETEEIHERFEKAMG